MAAEDVTPESPFSSWVFDTATNNWAAPIDIPVDGKVYTWDEAAYQTDNSTGWVALNGE